MGQCILTGDTLSAANDSKAHVVPSALGGRLKRKGILCVNANGELNFRFDLPLISAFAPFMALLGGSRDRGTNQPLRMTDESGREYDYLHGERPVLARPEIKSQPVPEGTAYQLRARTWKETRTLLGKVAKDNPGFDVEEAMLHAVLKDVPPEGMLGATVAVGPLRLFPAVFVMSAIFSSLFDVPHHPLFRSYATHLLGDSTLRDETRRRIERVVASSRRREREHEAANAPRSGWLARLRDALGL